MKRQAGISIVGFIFILIIAAFVVYTGMKLVPAYMDYFSVSKALNTVASQAASSSMSSAELQRKLDTQELSQYFDDADIQQKNITVTNSPNGGSVLTLTYDKKVPWLGNIDFLMHFSKTVPLRATQG